MHTQVVEYLLGMKASVDAIVLGVFFQPKHGDLRDVHNGTYFGPTPLSFAASIGDERLMHILTNHTRHFIVGGLEAGWKPKVQSITLALSREGSLYRRGSQASQGASFRFRRPVSASKHHPSEAGEEERGDDPAWFATLDWMAVEWAKICADTDEEDWNPDYPAVQRVGSEADGFFPQAPAPGSAKNREKVMDDYRRSEWLAKVTGPCQRAYIHSCMHTYVHTHVDRSRRTCSWPLSTPAGTMGTRHYT